jgi:hypothetical protein
MISSGRSMLDAARGLRSLEKRMDELLIWLTESNFKNWRLLAVAHKMLLAIKPVYRRLL